MLLGGMDRWVLIALLSMTTNPLVQLAAKDFVDKSKKLLFLVRQLQSVNAVSKDIIAKAVFSAIGDEGRGEKDN